MNDKLKTLLAAALIFVSAAAFGQNQKRYYVMFYNLENLFDTENDPNINDEEFLPNGAKRWTMEKYNRKQHNMEHRAWANFSFITKSFEGFIAAEGGFTQFHREGLYKKGLFPETSYGNAATQQFPTYSVKGGIMYKIGVQHFFSANVGYFTEAPYFAESYVSPRTRNDIVPNLSTSKTFSADLNYTMKMGESSLRLTGFYTLIDDQTRTISFYDDINRTFTNFSMSGINQRDYGVEFGAKVPIVLGFSLQGAASIGNYQYTSNPYFTETVDNSAKVVMSGEKVYWSGSYVPSTPQTAIDLGLDYRSDSYWFAGIDLNYFDRMGPCVSITSNQPYMLCGADFVFHNCADI